jgi:hypothetical protein
MIEVIKKPSSEGARRAFAQAARHNIEEIKKRINTEPAEDGHGKSPPQG